jgi:hypothetical protein
MIIDSFIIRMYYKAHLTNAMILGGCDSLVWKKRLLLI